MNNIKLEIEKESYRFNCPNYQGVIFVHPEDIKNTLKVLEPYADRLNIKSCMVTLKCGGRIKVSTVEGESPQFNYSGRELTSVLIDTNCFGKYKKVGTVDTSNFILYMSSRCNRSRSKHHSHLLLF